MGKKKPKACKKPQTYLPNIKLITLQCFKASLYSLFLIASLALFNAAFTSLFDIVAAKYKGCIISSCKKRYSDTYKMFIPLLQRGYFKQRNIPHYAKMHTALETDDKNDMVKTTH